MNVTRTLSCFRGSLLSGLVGSRVISATGNRNLTRNLVVLCANGGSSRTQPSKLSSNLCSCGCGIHGMHTRGDRELVEFLQEEIGAEKKALASVPSHVDDFRVKLNQAEVTMSKIFHDEEITISMNVNHSVDSEAPAELNAEGSEADLKSRPSFEVDIKVGSKTLSFTCSFTGPEEIAEGQEPGQEDVFGINELTIYEGEWGEETYCVSGDILDGMMYDLLMNKLEERGITNEFAEKLSNFCSDYEHSLYVGLLSEVQDFVKRK